MRNEDYTGQGKNREAEQEAWMQARKKRLLGGFGAFLIVMLILTFLSRTIYTNQLPQVSWKHAVSSSINFGVSQEGIVDAVSAQVIYGIDGLKIAKLHVLAGEQIEVGSLLYEIDLIDLQKKLAALIAEQNTWEAQADETQRRNAVFEDDLVKEMDISPAEASRRSGDAVFENVITESAYREADQRKARISSWFELLQNEGRVEAADAGTILEVLINTGEYMTDAPVIRYVNEESSLVFKASISAEDKAWIHVGDNAEIKFFGSKQTVSGTIDWIEEKNGAYQASVWLEPGEGQGETEGSMKVTYSSPVYDYVIPIQALHSNGDRCFVYVLREKEGILGTELSVRKMDVRVLEKSPDKAAVFEEILDSQTRIVTDSTKDLKDGDSVREMN